MVHICVYIGNESAAYYRMINEPFCLKGKLTFDGHNSKVIDNVIKLGLLQSLTNHSVYVCFLLDVSNSGS